MHRTQKPRLLFKVLYIKMENTIFDEIVNSRVEKIKKILVAKATEYASKTDRFHNFNIAGRVAGTTPEKALYGMMLKHEVSVLDLIEMADSEPWKLNETLIDEKIGDNINYLILLEGLLKQRCITKKCT